MRLVDFFLVTNSDLPLYSFNISLNQLLILYCISKTFYHAYLYYGCMFIYMYVSMKFQGLFSLYVP